MRIVGDRDLECLDIILLRHGHYNAVRLADGQRNARTGLVDVDFESLQSRDIDRTLLPPFFLGLRRQLINHALPRQMITNSGLCGRQTVLRCRQQQDGVAKHSRLFRTGGLVRNRLASVLGLPESDAALGSITA